MIHTVWLIHHLQLISFLGLHVDFCNALSFSNTDCLVWKLVGASSLVEFREKVGAFLPRIPRKSPPQGRTEFSGLNDLMQYLVDRSQQESKDKAAAAATRAAQS